MCQRYARLLCSAYLLNTDKMPSNAGTGNGDGGVSENDFYPSGIRLQECEFNIFDPEILLQIIVR